MDRVTSIPRRLEQRAAEHPDRPFALEVGGRELTYGEFQAEALQWAAALRGIGIEPGDRVVTMTTPSITAFSAWIGMAWLGAVDTACNTDYRGRMLAYLLANSGAKAVLVESQWVDRLAEVADRTPALETVIVVGDEGVDGDHPWRVMSTTELLRDVKPEDDLEAPAVWDTAMMIYTSGTTGPSKGVLIPWGQQYENTVGVIPADDLDADDCYYSPFPMFHGSGRIPLCLMTASGGRFVLPGQFSPTRYWEDIRSYGCTTTGFVGAMSLFLFSQPPSDDDADNPLKRAIMLPVIPQYRDFEERFGVKLRTCYAMTEVAPPFGTDWDITDPRSCGQVRPGFDVRLVDEHDFQVPSGEVGELIVRHQDPWTLNQGYFGMRDKTADAWRNGWFHTGDAFRRDEAGDYFFVDRIKDAIRRRGENISSFEVEALVNAHPGVAETAAIAVPSEWGEDDVKICVVPAEGADVTEEQLVRDLISTMPRFMVPRYVEFVEALAKTEATHRVKKVELRRDALNDRTWDREAAGIEVPK